MLSKIKEAYKYIKIIYKINIMSKAFITLYPQTYNTHTQ